jgi:hypothetical protein
VYGAFRRHGRFTSEAGRRKMRACFLGQNICNLGCGVAILQAPQLVMDVPVCAQVIPEKHVSPDQDTDIPEGPIGLRPVTNSPLLDA